MSRRAPQRRSSRDLARERVDAAVACAKALLPGSDGFERIAFAALVLRLAWKFKGRAK